MTVNWFAPRGGDLSLQAVMAAWIRVRAAGVALQKQQDLILFAGNDAGIPEAAMIQAGVREIAQIFVDENESVVSNLLSNTQAIAVAWRHIAPELTKPTPVIEQEQLIRAFQTEIAGAAKTTSDDRRKIGDLVRLMQLQRASYERIGVYVEDKVVEKGGELDMLRAQIAQISNQLNEANRQIETAAAYDALNVLGTMIKAAASEMDLGQVGNLVLDVGIDQVNTAVNPPSDPHARAHKLIDEYSRTLGKLKASQEQVVAFDVLFQQAENLLGGLEALKTAIDHAAGQLDSCFDEIGLSISPDGQPASVPVDLGASVASASKDWNTLYQSAANAKETFENGVSTAT